MWSGAISNFLVHLHFELSREGAISNFRLLLRSAADAASMGDRGSAEIAGGSPKVNVAELILCDMYGMALLSRSLPMALGAGVRMVEIRR